MNKFGIQFKQERFSEGQIKAIDEALTYAVASHGAQLRSSGEPYMIHPIAVAETVADWGLDHEAIIAAVLHDVVEDTEKTLEDVQDQFGGKVAELVDGVTKIRLSSLPTRLAEDSARREASNENLRKLLLASVKDYRVILIKLADRLHNLRTLEHLSNERRLRIARESLEVYAPLADRLGMGQLKAEIEDASFKYVMPEEYAQLSQIVKVTTRKSERYLSLLKHDIRDLLSRGGIVHSEVEGRQKHLYSIHKKLQKVSGDIDKIYDLIAIRIVVPDIASCYHALGLIHQVYKPLIYRIKDYIAVPKPNGYQSLHTTVFARDGRITEIQIRTAQMHEEAEHGLAAHFYYDARKSTASYIKGQGSSKLPKELKWVNQLADLHQVTDSGSEFVEGARLELFSDQIFIFSPKGDLYDLPEGSTALDFAFAIHSKVGLRTMGIKVNGRMAPIDTRLENRDVVEVITRKEPSPNRDWLSFVKTTTAKSSIRSWFRAASRESNVLNGRQALEIELKLWGHSKIDHLPVKLFSDTISDLHYRSQDDLFMAIGDGSITAASVIKRLFPNPIKSSAVSLVKRPKATGLVHIEGGEELPYTFAPCCNPSFPQLIVGYITRGSGVTVHILGCSNLPNDMDRFVGCRWGTESESVERMICKIELLALNRIGLVSEITGVIAKHHLNIRDIQSKSNAHKDSVSVSFSIEVSDFIELGRIMKKLERLPGITEVKKV